MSTLADRIEAGAATDAEVATALGWHILPVYSEVQGWISVWHDPVGNRDPDLPPFTTCLTTLAKECERRGLMWTLHVDQPDFANAGINAFGGYYDAQAPTPALALCAALIRAGEGETK